MLAEKIPEKILQSLLIFLSVAQSSCLISHAADERFSHNNSLYILDTPNPVLLEGFYINNFDQTHDTLILPPITNGLGPLFGIENIYKNQFFFLLTRDSNDSPS